MLFFSSLKLDCREIPLSHDKLDLDEKDEFIRVKSNCTVFLGYTSNMVSSGVRETIKYLVQNKFVSKEVFNNEIPMN